MTIHVSENDGNLTLTIDGHHRGISVEDAESLMEELEEAIESAKDNRE